MSVTIRRGYQLVIDSPGWGRTVLFGETPTLLDACFEAYIDRLQATKERRSAAILARMAGLQRRAYQDARDALQAEDKGR